MNPLASHILSAFLTLQPPGLSPHSLVEVSEGSPRACEALQSPLCALPWYSEAHGSHVRPETAEEGRARYSELAGIMVAVAERMTWHSHPRCKPFSAVRWADQEQSTECRELRLARPWRGSTELLLAYLMTVAYHESGLRRDVQTGIGERARGDRGKSWCVGQILLGDRSKTKRGWRGKDLVGTDNQSIERCIVTMVDYLSHARNVALSPYGPEQRGPTAVFMGYGGVTNASDPRIKARVATFQKLVVRFKLPFVAQPLLRVDNRHGP